MLINNSSRRSENNPTSKELQASFVSVRVHDSQMTLIVLFTLGSKTSELYISRIKKISWWTSIVIKPTHIHAQSHNPWGQLWDQKRGVWKYFFTILTVTDKCSPSFSAVSDAFLVPVAAYHPLYIVGAAVYWLQPEFHMSSVKTNKKRITKCMTCF